MTTDLADQPIRAAIRHCFIPAMAIAAAFFPAQAHADAPYDRCLQTASRSFDYNACGQAWLQREEAALTIAWRRTYGSISSPEARSALLAEQRKWIAYKDSACRFFGTSEFGSMGWSQLMLPCVTRIVQARTAQLGEYDRAGGEGASR